MPLEWVTDRISDALATSLSTIAGVDYHYPAPRVVQTEWFVDAELLDETITGPVYAIRPGLCTVEEATTPVCTGRAEFSILALQKFKTKDTPYFPASLTRRVVKGRMARDIVRRLLEDVQVTSLGGLVENVIADSLVIDRDQYYPDWALVELRFEVKFYLQGLP
jgi:hypothetical protein